MSHIDVERLAAELRRTLAEADAAAAERAREARERRGVALLLGAPALVGAGLLTVEASIEAGLSGVDRTMWADFGGGVWLDFFGKLGLALAGCMAWCAWIGWIAGAPRGTLPREALRAACMTTFPAMFVGLVVHLGGAGRRLALWAPDSVLDPTPLTISGTLLLGAWIAALAWRLQRTDA